MLRARLYEHELQKREEQNSKELNTKIILASIDFSKKEILLGKAFAPSGDNVKDILDLKKYYSSFTPRHPDKF